MSFSRTKLPSETYLRVSSSVFHTLAYEFVYNNYDLILGPIIEFVICIVAILKEYMIKISDKNQQFLLQLTKAVNVIA